MNRIVEPSSRSVSVLLRETYEDQTLGIVAALRRHRSLIGLLAVTTFAAALAVSLLLPNSYTAEALIQVDLGRPAGQQAAQPITATLEGSAIVESEARILRSNFLAQRVVSDLDLAHDPTFAPKSTILSTILPTTLPMALPTILSRLLATGEVGTATTSERIAKDLSRNLTVTNDTRAYLIAVTYVSSDPQRSARIVNAFVDAYMRNRLEIGVAAAERTGTWLQEQVRSTQAALEEADARVDRYRRQTGYIESSAGLPDLAQQELRDATTRLGTAVQNRLASEARLGRAREAFALGNVPSAQDLVGAPVIQKMLETVEAARRDVQNAVQMGPRHPGYINAKASLDDQQERLHAEIRHAILNLEADLRTAVGEETVLAGQVEALRKAGIEAMGRETQLRSLQAVASAIRERLKALNDGYAQAVAQAGMKSSTTPALMRAPGNTMPSGPNRALIVGFSVLGVSGVAIGFVLLLEHRRTGFRSATDLVRAVPERCLGMLPRIGRRPSRGELGMFEEAVQLIGASLGWSYACVPPHVLAVCSAVPAEGKSQLCRALAKSLTDRGSRVLVIDCNSEAAGGSGDGIRLTDAMAGDRSAFPDRSAGPGPTVLRAGGGDLRDPLTTGAFATFLERARQAFDVVLIEAPPVLLSQEAVDLAHHADATLLAVRWKRTPRETVRAALERLNDQAVRIRGIVLTQVDLRDHRRDRIVDQCYHYNKYRTIFEKRAKAARMRRPALPRLESKSS